MMDALAAFATYARHTEVCALSRAQVPSFGCLFPAFFRHYGGQCAEKLEEVTASGGRAWWHCMLRAGHVGPHRGSHAAGTAPNVWESGACTCGLAAVLAALAAQLSAEGV